MTNLNTITTNTALSLSFCLINPFLHSYSKLGHSKSKLGYFNSVQ